MIVSEFGTAPGLHAASSPHQARLLESFVRVRVLHGVHARMRMCVGEHTPQYALP